MNTPKRILIMAGGTGGHVFPALAVGKALQARGFEVLWLGTPKGMEVKWVGQANIPLYTITISGVRGKGMVRFVKSPLQILCAIRESHRIMRQLKPALVIGMGGYVSGPGGVAAWLLRKPLLIHEQNTIAGLTNRILARFASRVLESFPNTFKKQRHIVTTGNPVRPEIAAVAPPMERFAHRKDGPLHLLVLGGSRGATAINEIAPEAIARIAKIRPVSVWHQTGAPDVQTVTDAYLQKLPKEAVQVDAFIDDMAKAYAFADIVICRAGATTVAELAAVGLGSILVPYPHAVDDHQTANAEFLQRVGAAVVIAQSGLTAESLATTLLSVTEQRGKLLNMAGAARSLAKGEALAKIIRECEGLCGVGK